MLQLTENEEKFAIEFCKYYNEYGSNIPYAYWRYLGNFREKLGISIGRGAEITNYIEENGYKDLVIKIDETKKEEQWQLILESLNSEDYDNDTYQNLVDNWIEYYAETDVEYMVCYYRKALGWETEYNILFEIRKETSFEESEKYDKAIENANEESIRNIDKAIDLLDEENFDFWYCTLITFKSKRLHEKGKHLEAVKLAIKALPFACDNDEKEYAKWQISGKPKDSDNIIYHLGYGIEGRSIEERIKGYESLDLYEYDKSSSIEDNYDMLELCGLSFSADIKSIKNEMYSLANRPYHERQFIFTVLDLNHIGGCYDNTDTIQYIFAMDELPKNISFPIGHPQPNTLYYAHPLRPVYLPFENAQTSLFHERIQELCRLFQCLGATQITARCIKGEKISQSAITSYDFDLEGGYKVINGAASFSRRGNENANRIERTEMFLEQNFTPKKYPYCPEDLLWTLNDPEVQTFIHQRLEGSLLSFTKRVSSFETSSLTQNQINNVKLAFQSLIANLSINHTTSEDISFNSINETEWELNVEFKPMDEFDISTIENDKIKLPDNTYLLMPIDRFCPIYSMGIGITGTLLKDISKGNKVIIGDNTSIFKSEIKDIMLDFKSVEKAKSGDKNVTLFLSGVTSTNIWPGMNIYLEDITINEFKNKTNISLSDRNYRNLTENEEKYKEEILFCLEENNSISEEDRRYLERKRKKFNISEERAKEIEQNILPSLNDNEKEYLETFKEMSNDGIITERCRRLLEREREILGISRTRANEIEKLITDKNNL